MIYQICDVMMSINTWDRVDFWIYHLNHNSFTHQTWSIYRYKQGECFSKIFWTIWRTGAKFHFDQISFWQYLAFKRNKQNWNFQYRAMSIMTSQILKFVDFTKTQKSRYLENKTFFLRIKKFISYISRAALWQKLLL